MTTPQYRQPERSRLHAGGRLVLLMLTLFTAASAFAADHVEVRPIPNSDLGTWTGSGSLARTQNSCISSADTTSILPFGRQMPYQVKLAMRSASKGGNTFYIYQDGDTSRTGNKRIRVTFTHSDRLNGNSPEQLGYDSWDRHSHRGQFRGCLFSGNNSDLRVDIVASDLSGKVSGYYEGWFTLTAAGGTSGSATDTADFRVSVTVQARTEVQISNLDNLSLGTHSGIGNLYAEENFCVYSSSASGSYQLSVTSPNRDGSGNYFLDSNAGLGKIPYVLSFRDSGTGPGTVRVGATRVGGFGSASDPSCGGRDNATLSIEVGERDLQRAKSGTYRDTLTILVEPQ